MATAKRVGRLAGLAIAVGIATMALSDAVVETSSLAGAVIFIIGLVLAIIGVLKAGQAAVVRSATRHWYAKEKESEHE